MSPDQESTSKKHNKPPKFHLQFYDVDHEGVRLFLQHYQSNMDILTELYTLCHSILYNAKIGKEWEKHKGDFKHEWKIYHPKTITVIIRPMDGVAYTTGKMIDDDHKEIHFNAQYILNLLKRPKRQPKGGEKDDLKPTPTQTAGVASPNPTPVPSKVDQKEEKGCDDDDDDDDEYESEAEAFARVELEIKGVLIHEMVHTIQYDGKGTCPGGLIEGIADWVRLRSGLAPPHWKPHEVKKGQKWDSGYSITAYFLVWLETRLDKSSLVNCLNQALHHHQWSNGDLFNRVVQDDEVSLKDLWKEYRKEHKTPSTPPSDCESE